MFRARAWLVLALLLTAEGAGADGFRDDCGLEPPGGPVWDAVPKKPRELSLPAWPPHVVRMRPANPTAAQAPWGAQAGFLTGKTVYLSPGHGFTNTASGWRTQRGTTNAIVEDLVSAEAVQQYLARYLRQAGARVITVRESDWTPALAIVDDADGASDPQRGTYQEVGPATRFSMSANPGWGRYTPPLTGTTNPFTRGQNRLMAAAATADARAIYTPQIPEDGEYNVYLAYTQDAARAADAHVIVKHPGGEAHFRVDQRRHGGTWVLLGRFYFRKGHDPERGALVVVNDSSGTGAISLDAVRFGGGMGDIDRGGGASGRPRWEEAARYYAQWNGAPASVYDQAALDDGEDDVGTRSRFAAWDHEAGEDALYLAWHTNAPDPGVGTSSYVYGPNPPDGNYQFTGTAGSDVMMRLVHDEIVADLRRGWDPAWRDRGRYTAYFGEVNPNHNGEMPAALIEVAFHSTASDATQLKQANFRRIVTRAMYQGIARYFAQKDNRALRLVPEPPVSLCARGTGAAQATVSWRPPPAGPADLGGDPATGFRVYRSTDGLSWDEGTDVTDARLTIAVAPGAVTYLRVTSTNAGGESLPTQLVAVRTRADGVRAKILVLNGFDRLDGGLLVSQDLSPFALGQGVLRMLLDHMNDGSYIAAHARAIAAAGYSFDACEHGAVDAAEVAFEEYGVVDLLLGEESTSTGVVTSGERSKLTTFVRAGGKLFWSGAEVAWGLASQGSPEDKAFATALGLGFASDDAGTYVTGAPAGGVFAGLGAIGFDDGSHGGYDVDFADVLVPVTGRAELTYTGGPQAGMAAAIANDARAPTVFGFGFPLDMVYDETLRKELFSRMLASFAVMPDPAASADGGVGDGGDGGDATPGGTGACDCRTGGRARAPVWTVILAALALAIRRRSGRWRRSARDR